MQKTHCQREAFLFEQNLPGSSLQADFNTGCRKHQEEVNAFFIFLNLTCLFILFCRIHDPTFDTNLFHWNENQTVEELEFCTDVKFSLFDILTKV